MEENRDEEGEEDENYDESKIKIRTHFFLTRSS